MISAAARRRAAVGALALALAAALGAGLADGRTRAEPEAPSGFTAKPLVSAERWMIVAANPLAAEAGRAALRAGGSAIDAAIAAQLALNVVEPQSSGLGGGGFALLWDPAPGGGGLAALDGRETAPAAARPDRFLGPDGAPLGFLEAVGSGRSIGTPGLARLLEEMHRRGGRLPWARLFEPAIALAEEGFAVSPRLARMLDAIGGRLAEDPAARRVFFDAEGRPAAAGARLRQPALAATLRALAAGGADALHHGPIAEAVAAAAAERRSAADDGAATLTLADLSAYRVVERRAVCAPHKAFEICGMGPPSSGGLAAAQILGLAARAEPPDGPGAFTDAAAVHRFLEASRLAFADRARFVADPDALAAPTPDLLAPSYLDARAALMAPERAGPVPAEAGAPPAAALQGGALWPYAADPGLGGAGTTHVSVVDGEGRAVALTSSIETGFGAGRMAAGMLLNNQLTDFAFAPMRDGVAVANAPGPRKRPRSSMAPTLVFRAGPDGGRRLAFVIGSPGGSRIIEYVARALSGVIDHGLALDAALAAPHVSHRNRRPALVEARADADALAAALRARGYEIRRGPATSGLHAIAVAPDGSLRGAADPRREGVALGD